MAQKLTDTIDMDAGDQSEVESNLKALVYLDQGVGEIRPSSGHDEEEEEEDGGDEEYDSDDDDITKVNRMDVYWVGIDFECGLRDIPTPTLPGSIIRVAVIVMHLETMKFVEELEFPFPFELWQMDPEIRDNFYLDEEENPGLKDKLLEWYEQGRGLNMPQCAMNLCNAMDVIDEKYTTANGAPIIISDLPEFDTAGIGNCKSYCGKPNTAYKWTGKRYKYARQCISTSSFSLACNPRSLGKIFGGEQRACRTFGIDVSEQYPHTHDPLDDVKQMLAEFALIYKYHFTVMGQFYQALLEAKPDYGPAQKFFKGWYAKNEMEIGSDAVPS